MPSGDRDSDDVLYCATSHEVGRAILSFICCYSAPDRGAEYCDHRVCLSVCLSVREHISGITRPIFTKFLCILQWPWLGSVATYLTCGGAVYNEESESASENFFYNR